MMTTPPLIARSVGLVLGTANRRSLATGIVLATTVWALACRGAGTQESTAMALLMVLCGGTAAVIYELDAHCRRRRLRVTQAYGHVRLWVCLQGVSLLATLHALGTLSGS